METPFQMIQPSRWIAMTMVSAITPMSFPRIHPNSRTVMVMVWVIMAMYFQVILLNHQISITMA